MRINKILTLILLLLFVSIGTNVLLGQTSVSTKESAEIRTKRVNIYHTRLGSLELPKDYKAYRTEGFIDAWFGWIESADGTFRINWAAGTVESLFEKYKKSFEWIKTETNNQNTITLGLMRAEGGKRIVAGFGKLEFTAQISDQKEQDLFMTIIRSYQSERCEKCLTAPFKSRQK